MIMHRSAAQPNPKGPVAAARLLIDASTKVKLRLITSAASRQRQVDQVARGSTTGSGRKSPARAGLPA
jgi:hypothetical protein